VVGAGEIAYDVTDRIRAEKLLKTNLQHFHLVLSNMSAGILLVTNKDQVEFVNQAFCNMFDLKDSPADLIGFTSYQLIEKVKNAYVHPEEDIARIRELISLCQPVKGEEISIKGERTYLQNLIPIYIGEKLYGRLWHFLDITERKRSEEALHETKEYLENLLNYANAPIIVWDSSFKIVRFNNAFEKLTGFKADEYLDDILKSFFQIEARKIR
jgi:PAS domain S-box-containing protein